MPATSPGLPQGLGFWGLQLLGSPRAPGRKESGYRGQRAGNPREGRGLDAGSARSGSFCPGVLGDRTAPDRQEGSWGQPARGLALLPPVCLLPHPRLWVAPRTRPSPPLPPPPLAGSARAAAARPWSRDRPAERASSRDRPAKWRPRSAPRRPVRSREHTCLTCWGSAGPDHVTAKSSLPYRNCRWRCSTGYLFQGSCELSFIPLCSIFGSFRWDLSSRQNRRTPEAKVIIL